MSIKRKKVIISLIITGLVGISICGCSSNNFNISKDQIISDLDGKTIGVHTVKSSEIKDIKIIDQSVTGKTAKVSINMDLEYTDKGAGMINKYQIKNDILSKATDSVVLNYSNQNKDWQLVDLTDFKNLNNNSEEVETSIKMIDFKSDNEILQDLKDNKISIPTTDKPSIAIDFADINSNTVIKTFKILKVENKENSEIFKVATISIDADFDRNILNNMYEDNGHYNAKGQFKVLYQLKQDSKGDPVWSFASFINNSNEIKLTLIK